MDWISSIVSVSYVVKHPLAKVCCCEPGKGVADLKLMSGASSYAAAMIFGGLDSLLAARVVMDQGIHVEGINFFTGFCVKGHTHAIRQQHRAHPKRNNELWVAEQLTISLHNIDIIEEYKQVVINPKHGYGANMPPVWIARSVCSERRTNGRMRRGLISS
jgi:hypothetical protein